MWRALVLGKNRNGWWQKLFGFVPRRKSQGQAIWIHAVSVGEVNLLAPIIAEIKQQHPGLEIAISTTTQTGFELALQKYAEHVVFYCPFDFTWAIKRVIKRIRPEMLVLAELELWPNLIATTHSRGIPVTVVNGRLSENSFKGYQRIKWMVEPSFRKLSFVGAQNETYANRFKELGCPTDRVVVTGNVKFDGVQTNRDSPTVANEIEKLKRIANVSADEWVFVAGSTQPEEDKLVAQVYKQLKTKIPKLRLIIVPRHPNRSRHLGEQLTAMGLPSIYRSSCSSDSPESIDGSVEDSAKPIFIVDVIGELTGWWGVANAGYVGGSMGSRGGQNMMEPAGFGIPISFGPNTVNFRDVVSELLFHDAATVVQGESSLREFVSKAFFDPDWSAESGANAQKVVLSNIGAAQRTVEFLCAILDPAQSGFAPNQFDSSHPTDAETKAA